MIRTAPKFQFCREVYKDKIAAVIATDPTAIGWPKDSGECFERFALIDPRHNQDQKPFLYLNWLINEYLKPDTQGSYFPAGEFNDLVEALRIFEKYKNELSGRERDIQNYNIQSIIEKSRDIIAGVCAPVEALFSAVPEDVRRQTTMIYNGEEGYALVPHSRRSAAYWSGELADWCTSVETERPDNRFHQNNVNGPLIILMPPERDMYQTQYNSKTITDKKNKDLQKISVELKRLVDCIEEINPQLVKFTLGNKPLQDEDPEKDDDDFAFAEAIEKDPHNWELIFNRLRETDDYMKVAMYLDDRYFSNKDFVMQAMEINPNIYAIAENELRVMPEVRLAAICGSIDNEYLMPLEYLDTLSDDTKKNIFYNALDNDWRVISYAHDFGIELDIDTQIDVLECALDEDGAEEVAKCLHLFPELRPLCVYADLDPYEELDYLKEERGKQRSAYFLPCPAPYTPG